MIQNSNLETNNEISINNKIIRAEDTVQTFKLLYELYIRASYFISFNKYTNTQVIILLQLSH